MSGLFRKRTYLSTAPVKPSYDVVVIGGGGHGLAAAYYLAKNHGIKNVAVIERNYIGSGGTGRNTTVVRSNYNTPQTIKFFDFAVKLYEGLSQELDYNMLLSNRGILWMGQSEYVMHNQIERSVQNQFFGVDTIYMTPAEIKNRWPVIDITGGGHMPVLGASYHVPGCIIRHDAVAWGYAAGAQRLGVHIHQGVEVTGVKIENNRCTGVETTAGPIAAGAVLSAVGGYVTQVANMAKLRLPIITHPLQAFVTEAYKPVLGPIVSSVDMHLYISQSSRGEFLIGAEIDPYTSYNTRSTFPFLSSTAARAMTLFPFLGKLKILRQWTGVCDMTPDYSPMLGITALDRFFISTGWGTWGFKAIPASGWKMAELIASGTVPDMIAPFAVDRFRTDSAVSERSSAGTH